MEAMHSMTGLRILITQRFLSFYGGSEIITLELSEYFSGPGAKVLFAVHGYLDDLVSRVGSDFLIWV